MSGSGCPGVASWGHCDTLWPGNRQLWQEIGRRRGTGWRSPGSEDSRQSGHGPRPDRMRGGEFVSSPVVELSLGAAGDSSSGVGLVACPASVASGRVSSTWIFSAPRGPSQSGTLLTVLANEFGPGAWCTASLTPANEFGFSGVGTRRSSTWIFSEPRGPSQSGTVRIVRVTGSLLTAGEGGSAGYRSGRAHWPEGGCATRAARQAST